MQTMASVLRGFLEDKNGVPKVTKDGLNQMMKEQFPHFKKKEISPGVYELRIPLVAGRLWGRERHARKWGTGSPHGVPGTREEIPGHTEEPMASDGQEGSTAQLTGQKLLQVSGPPDFADIVDEAIARIQSIFDDIDVQLEIR
ncbi:UNVERIFIED_CONTAM: hypothetical protein K2H54_022918 [Gekko kuhli]